MYVPKDGALEEAPLVVARMHKLEPWAGAQMQVLQIVEYNRLKDTFVQNATGHQRLGRRWRGLG